MNTNLKSLLLVAAASLALSSGASVAGGREQLAASAGIRPSRGRTSDADRNRRSQIQPRRFHSPTSRKSASSLTGRTGNPEQLAAAAGLRADEAAAMNLTEIAARFFNRGSSGQDQQTVRSDEGVTMGARQTATGLSAGARQLAASAGLTEEEARGLSLRQIAAHAFNHDESFQDRQRTDLR